MYIKSSSAVCCPIRESNLPLFLVILHTRKALKAGSHWPRELGASLKNSNIEFYTELHTCHMFLYAILVYWRYLHTSFVFLLRKLSSTVTILPNKGTSLDIHICTIFYFHFPTLTLLTNKEFGIESKMCNHCTKKFRLLERKNPLKNTAWLYSA